MTDDRHGEDNDNIVGVVASICSVGINALISLVEYLRCLGILCSFIDKFIQKLENIVTRGGDIDLDEVLSPFGISFGDRIELLKFLDVESYEWDGKIVIFTLGDNSAEGKCSHFFGLLDADKRGSKSAMTMGINSPVNADDASHNHDLHERFPFALVSDYIELVTMNIAVVDNDRVVSWQPLFFGTMLNLPNVSNKNMTTVFLLVLLHKAIAHGLNEIREGRYWVAAIADICKEANANLGEFEEVVLNVMLLMIQVHLLAKGSTSIVYNPGNKLQRKCTWLVVTYVLLQFRVFAHGVIKLLACYIFIVSALRTRRLLSGRELIGTLSPKPKRPIKPWPDIFYC